MYYGDKAVGHNGFGTAGHDGKDGDREWGGVKHTVKLNTVSRNSLTFLEAHNNNFLVRWNDIELDLFPWAKYAARAVS